MSVEPFKKLVKLTARAFYDDSLLNNTLGDTRGIGVVILDALCRRRQCWVKEDDLATELNINRKQLRKILCFFEEEKLVMRVHRKETVASVTATHSYCCLDYAQIYDVVQYRMHHMTKKLNDERGSRNKVQEYICHNCNRRYNALDAMRLVSMEDGNFYCEYESCKGELVLDGVSGDDNARRCRSEKVKELFEKIEVQLRPLVEQINRVKDLPVPEFESFQAWKARLFQGGTSMTSLGDPTIEVTISEKQDNENSKSVTADTPVHKVMPYWMIRQGMNLTEAQRGVIHMKDESKMDGNSVPSTDGKKSTVAHEELNYQDQSTLSDRQVGEKSRREDEADDDDVEWEEG